MRTRPREMMRMLATFRHSAKCAALRAAAGQQALRLADEEAAADPSTEDNNDIDDAEIRLPRGPLRRALDS